MTKIKLGVNIDHVATIRNARGEIYPDPLKAALIAQKSGADSITIHLREDRRHIKDYDLKKIKQKLKIPLNLEMAPTKEMLKNLKVTVIFMNHSYQTRKDLYISLEKLWKELFNYIGIKNFEIIPQIDII